MQRTRLQHIIRGCGNLPHCGSHPGTSFIIGLPILGAIAGYSHGVGGMILGSLLFLIIFGPIYLNGAYHRSKINDDLEQKAEAEKKSPPFDPTAKEAGLPYCTKCGGEMRPNVPRMGWAAGGVHVANAGLECPTPPTNQK